ncbi:MAG: hypothetical protein U9R12_01640 [Candidatus Caldatribacteriota bacterium]|nr:hypothetical protein [Candidatus Caldatribacteriota bacterium]
MTTRQKKVDTAKIDRLTTAQMSEIWKVNRAKKLSPEEMDQFNLMRTLYKERTGREMPKHSLEQKG